MHNLFTDRQTGQPLDYHQYNADYGIAEWFGLDVAPDADLQEKREKPVNASVDSTNTTPFAPELDDLIRLHFLCLNRRVTTILEFGVGKSTRVFADALRINRERHGDYVSKNLRRGDPFRLFSVDNAREWVDHCRQELPADLAEFVEFTIADVEMTTFNDRICTAYTHLPNVCPDLIYIDGPGQFGVRGAVRGISTEHRDRLPMSADVLMIEPFLLPGTLILLDGRTANARFLKHNLQGNWEHQYFPAMELHAFELREAPLGRINRAQLAYCLGWEV